MRNGEVVMHAVAAENLQTDFRFRRGAGKVALNGFPLRGVPGRVHRGGELKNFAAITGHGLRMKCLTGIQVVTDIISVT